MQNKKGPLALIILDGFGYRAEREGNAIALAEMPFYNDLLEKYPHTLIEASGECVGLPKGVMGNSNALFNELAYFNTFRSELEQTLHHYKLPPDLCSDNVKWANFLLAYTGVIEDGTLACELRWV